jgi:lipopolysaccharide/colanic/teichoic acid biosynthesis glycosyltransferase
MAQMQIDFDCEVFSYPLDWPVEEDDSKRESTGSDRGAAEDEAQRAAGDGKSSKQNEASGFHLVERDDLAGLARARGKRAERPVADLGRLMTRPLPWWKRGMDVVVSAGLLLLLSPLLALIAVIVKLTSPGPVIFKQMRAGIGGTPFTFLKFRSMYVDAEARRAELLDSNEVEGPIFKMKNDPRITPFGRILRRTSLDEVPQLVNVLRGDMTLVGPRPPTLDEVPSYERWQRQRLNARGGLTCIWQVSGRSEIAFIEWVRMDLRYIANRSFLYDLWLLARTAGAVISRRGAY